MNINRRKRETRSRSPTESQRRESENNRSVQGSEVEWKSETTNTEKCKKPMKEIHKQQEEKIKEMVQNKEKWKKIEDMQYTFNTKMKMEIARSKEDENLSEEEKNTEHKNARDPENHQQTAPTAKENTKAAVRFTLSVTSLFGSSSN